MRAILVLIGLAAVVVVILMSLGMLNLQMQSGSLPKVSVNGGELPKVKAETGSIELGTKNTTVTTPTINVKPAATPTPGQ